MNDKLNSFHRAEHKIETSQVLLLVVCQNLWKKPEKQEKLDTFYRTLYFNLIQAYILKYYFIQTIKYILFFCGDHFSLLNFFAYIISW